MFAEQAAGLADNTLQAKDLTFTLASELETLKSQRRNEVSVSGTIFRQLTEPTPEAQVLLDLLARQLGSAA